MAVPQRREFSMLKYTAIKNVTDLKTAFVQLLFDRYLLQGSHPRMVGALNEWEFLTGLLQVDAPAYSLAIPSALDPQPISP